MLNITGKVTIRTISGKGYTIDWNTTEADLDIKERHEIFFSQEYLEVKEGLWVDMSCVESVQFK